jgi:hypothetical protein
LDSNNQFNGAYVVADTFPCSYVRSERRSQSKLPVMNNSKAVFDDGRVRRSIPMVRKMMIVLLAAALAGGLGASDALARGGGGGGGGHGGGFGGGGHMGGGFGGGHMGGGFGHMGGGFGRTHLGGFGDGNYGCGYSYYNHTCYPYGG